MQTGRRGLFTALTVLSVFTPSFNSSPGSVIFQQDLPSGLSSDGLWLAHFKIYLRKPVCLRDSVTILARALDCRQNKQAGCLLRERDLF